MPRAAAWWVGVALVLAACSGPGAALPAPPQPSAAASPGSSAPSTPPPTVTSTTRASPSSSPVLAANAELSAALAHLATATKDAHDSNTLSAPRANLRSALGGTRQELTATRSAAYHSVTRSCTVVWSHASAARSSVGTVDTARGRVLEVTRAMKASVATLKSKRATVARDWSALATILEHGQDTRKVVTSKRVHAALEDARQVATGTLAAASQAEASAKDAVAKACSMRDRAVGIAVKTCG